MRNIGLVALAVVALVVLLVLLMRPGGDGDRGPAEMRYADIFQEACGPVSPDSLGAPWPDDDALDAIRASWQGLGFRDSTIYEELIRTWIHPAGRRPARVTNIRHTPTGRDLDLVARMELGRALLSHPRWRMGSMRYFPVAAAVLSTTEKCVLSQLGHANPEAWSAPRLVGALELPAAEVENALDELTALGWLHAQGPPDSLAYRLADAAIARSGALQFVRQNPASGNGTDYASLTEAFHDTEALTRGRVSIWGPCAQTGRIIRLDLLEGRLRRGRPGNAWAAEVGPPGLSTGLFSSRMAFNAWKEAHENAEVGFSGSVVEFYHRTLEGAAGP